MAFKWQRIYLEKKCCANYIIKKSTVDNVDLDLSVIKAIENHFYIDVFIKSHSAIKYLTEITKSVISHIKNADFRLTKFASNSQDIIFSKMYKIVIIIF